MITGKGVGFLVAAITIFFLARLTQVGWLYLVDAVLWGIILLSAVLPWLGVPFLGTRRRLEHQRTSEGVTGPAEGESLDIELSLRNRAFWPRFFLSVAYDCGIAAPDNRRARFFLGKLPGSGQSAMSSSVVAHQRGLYQLGQVMVEASAPFELFRRRVSLGGPQDVLVYPEVYSVQRMGLVDGLAGAVMQRRKSRVGMETAGSRPYFAGDPRRYIHWRNTARAGRPMVREFEDPRDQTLNLLFDASQVWGEGKETTLEYSIKIVVSAADYARRHRVAVRLWGGNLRGETTGSITGGGQEAWAQVSWPEVLRNLALVQPGDGRSLSDSLGQVPAGSSALVVVAAEDVAGIRAIKLAAAKLHRLVVVALEDFGEPEVAANLVDSLEAAWVPVVRCMPGQLQETLEVLGQEGAPTYGSVGAA